MNSDFGSRILGSAVNSTIECSHGEAGRQKPASLRALENLHNLGFLIVLRVNYSGLLWQLRPPVA